MSDQQIPDRPLIHGKQVWLRSMEERDLPAYIASINDTEVGGRAGFRVPVSVSIVHGRPVDSILMAMLRSEWAETQTP